MRKILFNILIIGAVLLAACSQATPAAPPAANPTAPSSPATAANPTATVAQAADTPTTPAAATQPAEQSATQPPTATGKASAAKMDCQVVSASPTQGPTEISMFPPAGKDDWVLGKNASAALSIIEYSDFQ